MCNCIENKIKELQRDFAKELEAEFQNDFLKEGFK